MIEIRLLWDKRMTPAVSFTHLTNPFFHNVLRASGESPYLQDKRFLLDVKKVIRTMAQKRFPGISNQKLSKDIGTVMNELDKYFNSRFKKGEQMNAEALLAADWWAGYAGLQWPTLAFYATKAHASEPVGSVPGRFFSSITDVQSKKRGNLGAGKAALFSSARRTMLYSRSKKESADVQMEILAFVRHMQEARDAEGLEEITKEGMRCAEKFLKALAVSGKSLVSSTTKEAALVVAEEGVDTGEHDVDDDESEDEAENTDVEDEEGNDEDGDMQERVVEERARGGGKEDVVDGGTGDREGNEGEEQSEEETGPEIDDKAPGKRLLNEWEKLVANIEKGKYLDRGSRASRATGFFKV